MSRTTKLTHSLLVCLLVGASMLCTGCSAHKKLVKSPTPAATATAQAPAATTENTAPAAAAVAPTAQPAAEKPTTAPTAAAENPIAPLQTMEETPTAATKPAAIAETPAPVAEPTPAASEPTPARTRNNKKSVAPATPAEKQPQETAATKEQPQETAALTDTTTVPEATGQPTPADTLSEETAVAPTYPNNTNTLHILNWSIIIILLLLLLVAIVVILIQRKKLKDAHEREDYLKSRLNNPAVMQAEVATPKQEEPEKELINSTEEHDRLFGAAPIEQTEEPVAEPEQVATATEATVAAETAEPVAEEAEETTQEQPVAAAVPVAEPTAEPAAEEVATNEEKNTQDADNQAVVVAPTKVLASQAMLKKLLNERVQMEQPFKTPNQIKAFMKSFDEAYPGYMSGIKQAHPEVTDADALVIAFMINELNIQQICIMLNSKPRTVWSRRLRIKTHLGLTQNDDLDQWVKDSL